LLDVAIIGGGPSGSTAGRLLAQWGYAVGVFTPPPSKRPPLAECLPPSTCKLFRFLGIDDAIDRAGFLRTTGNTVWWGKSRRRVEQYAAGYGYQIVRGDFDRLLSDLAIEAGARVDMTKVARNDLPPARIVIDCSGRAGVLARAYRQPENKSSTVALCGIWHSDRGWKLPDASHTLVEAYGDGWAWSVPVSATTRYVAFMVGPGETRIRRGEGLEAAYLAELAKTRAFQRIFRRSALEQKPWGADASTYSSRQYSGPGFLLAGDAASFIDPLSSFGVKKAMASAWVAAVVVNTCLTHPKMQEAALRFYDERERRVYEAYRHQSARMFGDAAGRNPFWTHRSDPDSGEPEQDHQKVQDALVWLKKQPSLSLRRAAGVRIEPRPRIEGREVILKDALVLSATGEMLDFIENVDLSRLLEIAERCSQVPQMFEAYNRAGPSVALPNFLAALSSLVARGVLTDETHPR